MCYSYTHELYIVYDQKIVDQQSMLLGIFLC